MRLALFIALALCLAVCQSKQVRGGYQQFNLQFPPDFFNILTQVSSQAPSRCNFAKGLYVLQVLSAESQVVAGTNYRFTLRASNGKQFSVQAAQSLSNNYGESNLTFSSCQAIAA